MGFAYLDFYTSHLKYNNLGGQGPGIDGYTDPCCEELRFEDIGHASSGLEIDLTVKTLQDDYEPKNSARNGLSGYFGQVNMKGNEHTLFEFCFVIKGTDGSWTWNGGKEGAQRFDELASEAGPDVG